MVFFTDDEIEGSKRVISQSHKTVLTSWPASEHHPLAGTGSPGGLEEFCPIASVPDPAWPRGVA